MFVIHNLTNKTITISDLRIEIGPKRIIDIEAITDRRNIEGSRDLKTAIKLQKIAVIRPVFVNDTNQAAMPSKPLEKAKSSKPDIQQMIQKTISEEMGKINKNSQENTLNEIKSLLQNMASQNIQTGIMSSATVEEKTVSDERLAEISQKYITKLSDGIESNISKNKKIISDTNIDDLADML